MFRKNQTKRVLKHLEFKATMMKKDASGDCLIEGYANTSTKDRVGDVVQPEAFAKSLPTFLRNPVLLANHDWNDPCGKVLTAEITDKGLYITARISNTREDIKTLINEGCLSTFSIGYNEIDADFDESTKTKYVKELELLEISVVTVPANIEASFTVSATKTDEDAEAEKTDGAKSAPVRTAKQLKDFIDTVKSVVGNDLTGNEIIAVCDYFNNTNEETMTKAELIAILKAKSAPAAAAAPEAAKADAPAQNADGEKPADAAEAMKQILAKLDAIGQALAQIMEGQKPAEDKPKDDEKKDDAEADKDEDKADDEKKDEKPKDDEDEMSDEDCEKAIEELSLEIAAMEDAENV